MCSYGGGCGYSGGSAGGYSRLESITYQAQGGEYHSNVNYLAEAVPQEQMIYRPETSSFEVYKNSNQTLYNISKSQPTNIEYTFTPDNFLIPGRTKRFIGDAEQIQEEIEEAFLKTTGLELPSDISINICSQPQFKKMICHAGVRGFSINRKQSGQVSEIFILNDDLARVMLTIGHEIGHVMSKSLKDRRLEEAKAFAFSKAWMKTIKKHNIANLSNSIVPENPANNGIHDIAHQFTNKFKDKDPLMLYWEIVRGQHVISS
ncbi:hypothetical protein ACFLZB_03665 [Nanoarchaeota archaeon]